MKPDVFIFNASNDDALAADSTVYVPNKTIRTFEADLAILPMVFARECDIVLVDALPPEAFIEKLRDRGFTIPQFTVKDTFLNRQYKDFSYGTIKPWGWSRHTHRLFHKIKPLCNQLETFADWNIAFRDLCGRHSSARMLESIVRQDLPYMVGIDALPQIINSFDQFASYIDNGKQLMLKSPWSSSGRGLMHYSGKGLTPFQHQWINRVIEKQGFVMLEPFHDKIFDYSMLFDVSGTDIKLLSLSTFKTHQHGKYQGSYLHWPKQLPFLDSAIDADMLESLSMSVINALQLMNIGSVFNGWIGVDAMVICQNGQLLIHPWLELNCRYTMGHVAYRLSSLFTEHSHAFFKIGTVAEFQSSESTSFLLTPIYPHTRFAAWVEKDKIRE